MRYFVLDGKLIYGIFYKVLHFVNWKFAVSRSKSKSVYQMRRVEFRSWRSTPARWPSTLAPHYIAFLSLWDSGCSFITLQIRSQCLETNSDPLIPE